MPETTNNTPRLLAAAKEFNIGKDTLIDFLANKGYDMAEFGSPNARLTSQMYGALQSEFQQDKANKRKSDQIALPKGTVLDAAKKKEKEEAEAAAAAAKKNAPAKEDAKPEPVATTAPEAPAPPKAEPPKQEPPVPQAEAPVKQPEPTPEPPAAETKAEPAKPADTSRISGPKVVATIDLEALNRNRKPATPPPAAKKETPAEPPVATPPPAAEKPQPEPQPEPVKPAAETVAPKSPVQEPAKEKKEEVVEDKKEKVAVTTEEAPVQTPATVVVKETPSTPPSAPQVVAPAAEKQEAPEQNDSTDGGDDDEKVISNIQAEKLTGPKVIGKINLPVNNDRRDNKAKQNENEKRKRKRIIVEKKPEPIKPGEFPQDRGNRGPGGGARPQGGQSRPYQERNPGGGQGGNRGPGQGPGGPGGNRNNNNNRSQGPGGQGNRPHSGPNRGGNFGNRPGGQGGGFRSNQPDNRRPEDKEIDKNEIQNKIKETMAKLGGNTRGGKNTKATRRREKRQVREEQMANQGMEDNKLQVTEFVSVSELANLMDVSFAEVISKCMGLGIMVSINQRLDAEVIELVAGEFGYEVEFIGLEDADEQDEEEVEDDPADLVPRAPIVTIMGHVDHGKTSLLDYIRNANVVAGEAGGITQHIGAYQVTTATGKKLTFLDTPGHEAFTAMRARGAKVADIAVIVVAADDAIMPQTKEAISHSQAAGLPMVFAINKIDKDGANPEKIKEQLAQLNLLVEDWGGKYQSQEISAKSGLNIDLLLEKILLEAELLELKANPDREGSGSIIEASLDKGRGYVTTLLISNGSLKQGDTIVSGQHFGKIKAMFNERGQRLEVAGPSSPVQILGLNGAPQAGEKFRMYEDESEAKDVANRRAQIVREQGIRTKKHITLDEIGRRLALGNFKQLNLIIKGDFDGSVEALSDSLQKLSTEEIAVSVVHKGVGQITESDVLLATASDALLIGFQVRPSMQAAKLAEKENIEIRTYSIIYDAIDELKSAMEGMLEPKIEKKVVCNVEIRETYKFDKVTVAGCFVLDGRLARNTRVNLVRDGIVVYTGELGSLKRYKDDVKEVVSNMECGLSIRNYNDIRVGDIVEGFEEVEVKRTL
ncbi:translation initiation factor IF-2 [Chitinophaga horti]|uniref:Translation initiation factor IF-2 n=1 Tax=Chitinophaga horti TaxID=2920382 RepID=A0ABY6IZ94_9BACT|nr:translation initiation factor IF-2 [Chitinophaga horti]UYQ92712.1 translation initiation factor IF-2 [Chitinophaga horti]